MLGNAKRKAQNSKLIIIFIFVMFFNLEFLFAGQEFNLKEAIDYALLHNSNILIAQNKIEKAKVVLKDAKRHLSPAVSLQLGYGPLNDRRGIGIGISQDLDRLFGGSKKEKYLAYLDLDSAREEFFLVEQQVIREVTIAFNTLEKSKLLLKLKEASYLDSQKILDLAKEKFNLGLISMDEFLAKQEAERLAEFDFRELHNDLKEKYLLFYQAIGYKEERDD